MRTIAAWVLVAVLAAPAPAAAQIPLSQVRILHTRENVLQFPVTAQLTEIQFQPGDPQGNLHLRFTKQGQWPPIDIGGALQEATLWIIARIDGEWIAAGMERLRPNQIDKPEGPDPAGFLAGWVEGRNFGPFSGHAYAFGEPIGVFVVAGQSRLGGDFIVRERTDVVELAFPLTGPIRWREGQTPAGTVPGPTPIVVPGPVVPSVDLSPVLLQLQALQAQLQLLTARADEVHEVNLQVQAGRDENKAFFESVRSQWKQILSYAGPIVAALFAGRAFGGKKATNP